MNRQKQTPIPESQCGVHELLTMQIPHLYSSATSLCRIITFIWYRSKKLWENASVYSRVYLHVKIRKTDQKPLLLLERRTTICLHSSTRSSVSHAHTHVKPAHAAYTFHLHLLKEKSHIVHSQPPCLRDQNKLRRRALGHQHWVKVCQSRGEAVSDAKTHADFFLSG